MCVQCQHPILEHIFFQNYLNMQISLGITMLESNHLTIYCITNADAEADFILTVDDVAYERIC